MVIHIGSESYADSHETAGSAPADVLSGEPDLLPDWLLRLRAVERLFTYPSLQNHLCHRNAYPNGGGSRSFLAQRMTAFRHVSEKGYHSERYCERSSLEMRGEG